MAKQFGTTAEVRNYGSVMVSSPAVAIYAAASGRFEPPGLSANCWLLLEFFRKARFLLELRH